MFKLMDKKIGVQTSKVRVPIIAINGRFYNEIIGYVFEQSGRQNIVTR